MVKHSGKIKSNSWKNNKIQVKIENLTKNRRKLKSSQIFTKFGILFQWSDKLNPDETLSDNFHGLVRIVINY